MKTSGKTGLHILTDSVGRGRRFDEARVWALELAERTAEAMPKQATVDIRKSKCGERVYIDVLQNARGHHAVPPYVLRTVPRGDRLAPPWTGKRFLAQVLKPFSRQIFVAFVYGSLEFAAR